MEEFEAKRIDPSVEIPQSEKKTDGLIELKPNTIMFLFEEVASSAYHKAEAHRKLAEIMNW